MKRILIFTGICFGISAVAGILFYLLGGMEVAHADQIFAAAYMFIPLISVVITQTIYHEKPLRNCGLNFHFNWWWLLAWLIMPILCFGSIGMSLLLPDVAWQWGAENSMPLSVVILFCLVAGATVNAIAALGEETAWRGFLAEELKDKNFWHHALVTGVIWGIWHAPLILMGLNYPQHPITGVGMMVVLCVLMAPLLLFIREQTGSTIAAAIAHGTLNAIAGTTVVVLSNYQEMLTGMTGVTGMLMLLIADGGIALYKVVGRHAENR